MIIPVILGPTCIGKTSLALEIAKIKGADILSIDSRQVFRELDIGTGKYKGDGVTSRHKGFWEVEGVKIWGYDLLTPNQELNVLDFCEFAKKIINEYKSSEKKLIATCGTGFYLDFLSGKILYNKVDAVRKEELHNLSLEECLVILKDYEKNPEIDLNNKLRVITRILSVESKSEKIAFDLPGVVFELFYLNEDRRKIYSYSDLFVDSIFEKGVIVEYQKVFQNYGECRSIQGLIYKDIGDFLAGKIFQKDLIQKVKFSLHAYIRRQQTYFKKMKIESSNSDRKDITEKIEFLL